MKYFKVFLFFQIICFLTACYNKNVSHEFNLLKEEKPSIKGQWIDENNIVSYFHDGVFETRSGDTKEKLAEGIYILNSEKNIQIQIFSFIRGTKIEVNCLLESSFSLVCLTKDNRSFKLKKIKN